MDKIIAKTTGKTSQIDSSIFKAYDIRGTYPHQINEYVAYRLGRAFVVFLKCKQVVIGRDMRLSSPSLHDALIMGITDQGADVVDVGICSTPMLYFSIADYDNESGIMITASHNPKEYNGFKLCRRKAGSISGYSGIEEIKKIMLENKFDDSKDRRSKLCRKDAWDQQSSKRDKKAEDCS
ncbi:MAG: hypothetical protein NT001_05250 [Candidatus Woesearchaeota archaeon]|nr:hypothetical protein [Candidatus Woesearchaeota archaeon]